MRKLFLLISVLILSLVTNATIPQLTKSTPLILNVSSEGFEMSGLDDLYYTDWINWGTGAITHASGYARWSVNVIDPAVYSVTLNVQSTNGFCFHVDVVDQTTGDTVTNYARCKSNGETNTALDCEKINMCQLEAGTYYFVLTDTIGWSAAKVQSVTLAYVNGDRISIPATLQPVDAMLSEKARLEQPGAPAADTLLFAPKGSEGYVSDEGYTVAGSQYVEWNFKVTESGYYQFTANTCTYNGHNYRIILLNADKSETIYTKQENADNTKYDHHNENGDPWAVSTEAIYLTQGNYVLKIQNKKASRGRLLNVEATYTGGAVQNISTAANTTLNVADALFTDGFTRADGQVSPGSWKPAEPNPLGYVKWNIATSETKFYDLTLNFSSTNAHSMAVNIYEDEESSPVATVSESYTSTTGILTLTDRVNLVGGKNYIVKVTNPTSGSEAKVTSVVFAPVATTSTALPNTLAFSNAVLSEKANITDGMLYFNEPGADKDPRGQWAQWEVTTDHNGLFLFTMGVTSENEQTYKITIKDGSDNVLDYYETSPGTGTKTLTHYFALNTGTYFVKVENTRSYSKGHLTSLVVTEPAGIVTIDESATDNTSWSGKVVDKDAAGPLYDVQIIRTIVAGMYNTICLPFAVSSDQCKDIFGSDVKIRTLKTATIDEDDVLTLDFETASDIYPGTPVLIQTSRDIVNPVFTGVKFTRATPSATTKTNANFAGTFVKTALEANENILFLGANNKLYFPTASVDIYGMRGWFVIHGVSASAIKRARIVENHNTATDIEIVGSQKVESQKLIENGQLVIIRDGIRYNALGIKLQ